MSVYPLPLDRKTARQEAAHARRVQKRLPAGHPYRGLPLWVPYWLARTLNMSAASSRPDGGPPARQRLVTREREDALALRRRLEVEIAGLSGGVATLELQGTVKASFAEEDRGDLLPKIAQGEGSRLQVVRGASPGIRFAARNASHGARGPADGGLRPAWVETGGLSAPAGRRVGHPVRVRVTGAGVTQLGDETVSSAGSSMDDHSNETTGPRRRTDLSSLKPADAHMQELRKLHATLHSAMDALIKELNGNEAARLLILMDDRLTSLINDMVSERPEEHGPFAAHPVFKGEIPAAGDAVLGDTASKGGRIRGEAGPKDLSAEQVSGKGRVGRLGAPGSRTGGAPIEPMPFVRKRVAGSEATPRGAETPADGERTKAGESAPQPVGSPVEAAAPETAPETPAAGEAPGFLPFKPVPVKFTRRPTPVLPPADAPDPVDPAPSAEVPVEEPPEDAPHRRWGETRVGVFGRFRSKFDALLKGRRGSAGEEGEPGHSTDDPYREPSPEPPLSAEAADAPPDDRPPVDETRATPVSLPVADVGLSAVMRALDIAAVSRAPDGATADRGPSGPEEPAPALPALEAPAGPSTGDEIGAPVPAAAATAAFPAADAAGTEPGSPLVPPAAAEPAAGDGAPRNVSDVNVRRLHNVADLSAASDILAEAVRKTGNRIELQKVEEGLDLVVKGIPKPLGTVRLSPTRASHVVYHPLFGLDLPSREPNRADLELWMAAMGDVVVRILDNITQRRKGRAAGKDDVPPTKDASGI